MNNIKNWTLLVLVIITIISCSSDETFVDGELLDPNHVSFVVKFEFPYAIHEEMTIKDGEDNVKRFELTKFKFLISDINAIKTDDTEVVISNNLGANLIDLSEADVTKVCRIYLSSLPSGEYKAIKFGIGVSETVENGTIENQTRLMYLAEKTDIDSPNGDMVWSLNPYSYIFSKIEGTNTADNITTKIHVNRTTAVEPYRTVTLNLSQNIIVKKEVSPSVHVRINLDDLFDVDNGGVEFSNETVDKETYSDQFATLFEVIHVHPSEEAIDLEEVE